MEQKKILWTVVTVGIFLLAVMGWALFTYAPQSASKPVMASAQPQDDVWLNPKTIQLLNEQQASEQNAADPQTPATTTPPAIAPDGTVPVATSSALPASTMQANDLTVFSSGNTTIFSADGVTTIDLTAGDAANTNVARASAATTSPVTEKVVIPVTTKLPSPSSTAKKTTSTAPSATTPKTATAKAATPVAVPKAPADQYWVQAASFTSKPNAESARKTLAEEKISAEVFTYDDKTGITYYRLRVGPYTTKSEAEYWNSFIKLIDPFAGTQSYVTNSTIPKA